MSAICAQDASFGPGSACRSLDFTITFEQTILSILPSAITILVAAASIYPFVSGRLRLGEAWPGFKPLLGRSKAPGQSILLAKLAVNAGLFLTQVAALAAAISILAQVPSSIPAGWPAGLVVAAASLSLVVDGARFPLEVVRHASSSAPSTLLLSISFLKAVFSGAILRTYSLALNTQISAQLCLFATQAIVTALASIQTLLCTAKAPARSHQPDPLSQAKPSTSSSNQHPDLIRGLLARAFTLWHFPLLRRGFQGKLGYSDLYTSPLSVQAQTLSRLFEHHWLRARKAGDSQEEGCYRIFVASVRAFHIYWIAPVVPKLIVTLAQLAQPIIFSDLIAFVASYSGSTPATKPHTQSPSRGWALAASVFLIYGLITIFTGIYWQHVYRSTFVYRSAMLAAVYRHVLHRNVPLPALQAQQLTQVASQHSETVERSSTVESDVQASGPSPSAAATDPVTIISADIETLATVLEQMHEIWSALVTVGVASFLLYARLGLAFLVTLSSIILLLLAASLLARIIPAKQKAWFEATEKRVTFVSALMHRFEQVKVNLAEAYFIQKATLLRESEIAAMRVFYRWIAQVAVLATSLMNVTTLATFAVAYAVSNRSAGKPLNSATVFSALTIVNMLEAPVNNLAQNGSKLISATASLDRIQAFLQTRAILRSTDDIEERSTATVQRHPNDIKTESSAPVLPHLDSWLWSVGIKCPGSAAGALLTPRLVLLQGPSGSGKTTLLRHLLRNRSLLSSAHPKPSPSNRDMPFVPVAFCPQDPWLFEGSIRENVVLDQPYDASRFRLALQLSQLDSDVDAMALREHTNVGSEGSNLSGGQGHRVALARALYSEAKVIVLDDSLSALDAGTTAAIVQNVLHPRHRHPLLQGTAIVIASHLNELRDICSLRCSVVAWRIHETVAVNHDKPGDEEPSNGLPSSSTDACIHSHGPPRQMASHSQEQVDPDSSCHSTSTKDKEQAPKKLSQATEADVVPLNASETKPKPTRFFFQDTSIIALVLAFVFCVLANASTYGVQVTLEQWVKHSGHGGLQHAGLYLGVMGVLTLLGFVTFFVAALVYFGGLVSQASRNTHRSALLSCLQHSIPEFAAIGASTVLNRLSTDQFICDYEYAAALFNFVFLLVGMLASLILIFVAAPLAAVAIPMLAIAYYYLQELYLRSSRQFRSMDLEARTALFNAIKEADQGVEVVRALGCTDWIEERGMLLIERAQMPYFARLSSLRFLRMGLYTITWILATLLSILSIALRRSSSSSALGLALTNVTSLSVMLNSTLQTWVLLETGKVAVERVESLARSKPPAPGGKSQHLHLETRAPTPAADDTPCLEWRDYSVRYLPDAPLVAQHVNLVVARNCKVGICGRSGSGKSTLLNSLIGTIERQLSTGELYVHGRDVAHLSLEQVRSCLTLVSQKPFVWQSSIREVLTLSVEPQEVVTDAEIWSALRSVHLDELVASTAMKLDVMISDVDVEQSEESTEENAQADGAKAAREELHLSRGQKQLLCMARAILQSKHRSILVLDEATSSLDKDAEQMLVETIRSQFRHHTVLAVAHRLITLLDFDQVYVMDKGQVIESGCPRDLLIQPGSVFRALATSQGLTQSS